MSTRDTVGRLPADDTARPDTARAAQLDVRAGGALAAPALGGVPEDVCLPEDV
jgi:hypothetical protein